MRNILIASGILVALASCSKNGTVAPNTTTTTKIDSATTLHTVAVTAPVQNTQTSLKDSTLTLIFREDVTLLLTPISYDQSYSVHLSQDFSTTVLAKINYTTTNGKGVSYYDYADDNLNNVGQKTISDTTINGVALKKIHVVRNFSFVKTYPNTQTATNALNTISNTYTDRVTFSSYVLFDKVYPSTSTTAAISYVH
ncbi:MAG: hypothetical protein ACXVAY_07315 [Mucilaginibacter sp.]